MGKLIWHDYARFVSITASCYAIWSAFFGLFYRKFFWDFVGGTLRDPGGIQPSAAASVFITMIVKVPIIQSGSILLALAILALECPLPPVKQLSIHRSFALRIVLLLQQSFLTILYYQVKIIAKIPSSYEKGLESGDLFFFASTIHSHVELNVPYEITLCPALQKKPALPTPHFETPPRKDVDPFSPPYNPNLFVGYLRDEDQQQEEYAIMMNKYSVVPRHFLLVTREFRSQSSPLMPNDLAQVYSLLAAAHKARKNMFAFYNCGDLSGASQPHKHVQFVEAHDEDGPPIEVLARSVTLETQDKPFSLTSLPYANHVYRFPQRFHSRPKDEIEETMAQAFLNLLDLVIDTIRNDLEYPAAKPSYNVVITLEHMHLIPRRQECHVLSASGEKLSVNALGFAGMLLVKSEAELEAVTKEGLVNILRGVGLKSVHDLQVQGTSLEAEEDNMKVEIEPQQ
ncbi:ATP adenylyltransferase-domain-containing protein [Mycena floridula]|nr:ATP adenylyltransferase-domain-containing protein [Mycena floridula]